jgi:hypothetical protein
MGLTKAEARRLGAAVTALILLVGVLSCASTAWACSVGCACDDVDVIFEGEVIDVHLPLHLRHIPTTTVKGIAGTTWRLWFETASMFDRDVRATFRVKQVWRGQASEFVTVHAGPWSALKPLEQGKDYLVYGVQTSDPLEIDSCTGTVSARALSTTERVKLGASGPPSPGSAPFPMFWRHLLLPAATAVPFALAALITVWHSKRRLRARSAQRDGSTATDLGRDQSL